MRPREDQPQQAPVTRLVGALSPLANYGRSIGHGGLLSSTDGGGPCDSVSTLTREAGRGVPDTWSRNLASLSPTLIRAAILRPWSARRQRPCAPAPRSAHYTHVTSTPRGANARPFVYRRNSRRTRPRSDCSGAPPPLRLGQVVPTPTRGRCRAPLTPRWSWRMSQVEHARRRVAPQAQGSRGVPLACLTEGRARDSRVRARARAQARDGTTGRAYSGVEGIVGQLDGLDVWVFEQPATEPDPPTVDVHITGE